MARSLFATRRRRTSFVDRYLNEPMEYGGVMSTRGQIIRDLQRRGVDAACIDRYLQGADLRAEAEERGRRHVPATDMIQ